MQDEGDEADENQENRHAHQENGGRGQAIGVFVRHFQRSREVPRES